MRYLSAILWFLTGILQVIVSFTNIGKDTNFIVGMTSLGIATILAKISDENKSNNNTNK